MFQTKGVEFSMLNVFMSCTWCAKWITLCCTLGNAKLSTGLANTCTNKTDKHKYAKYPSKCNTGSLNCGRMVTSHLCCSMSDLYIEGTIVFWSWLLQQSWALHTTQEYTRILFQMRPKWISSCPFYIIHNNPCISQYHIISSLYTLHNQRINCELIYG
jgi:hypothetical protein